MSSQQQLTPAQLAMYYPPNPGVPGWSPHFWEPGQTAYKEIGKIYSRGANYDQDDVVWNAWTAILRIYFPEQDDAYGVSWAIRREPYRGLPPQTPSQTRPDIIAVKLMSAPPVPGQPPQQAERDFLWVECKAASHDTPHGWKNLLEQTVGRLAHAHAMRPLSFILAVGWKSMFFFWDPSSILPQQPQYRIWSASRANHWSVDPRVKAIQSFAWVNTVQGNIIPENAMELDSWTLAPAAAGVNVLYNGNNLGIIETFIITIRGMPYHLHGSNPAQF